MKLRTGVLALALLGLVSLPAAAEGFKLFVEGGINSANPDADPRLTGYDSESSAGTGIVAGLGLEGRLSNVFSTQVEVLYVKRSTDFRYVGEGRPDIDATYDVTYVDIPWTLRARFGSRAFRPFLLAGIVSSVEIDAKSKNTSAGVKQDFDVDDQIRGWNLSLVGGLGLDIQASTTVWIRLEGRYLYGLKNIASGVDNWKTRDLQGILGVGFDL